MSQLFTQRPKDWLHVLEEQLATPGSMGNISHHSLGKTYNTQPSHAERKATLNQCPLLTQDTRDLTPGSPYTHYQNCHS